MSISSDSAREQRVERTMISKQRIAPSVKCQTAAPSKESSVASSDAADCVRVLDCRRPQNERHRRMRASRRVSDPTVLDTRCWR